MDTSNSRPYKTFLVRNLYTFYFRPGFTVSFKFSSIFILFLSLFNEWPFQFHKNENLQGFPVHIHLHGWCVSQLQRCLKRNEAEIETCIQSLMFLLHIANHLFLTVRISTNNSNSILVHFVGWLFHPLQTLANQWLPNYHIIMLSSNKLSLGSFFSQHRPLDTLWDRLYYTVTP